MSNSSEDEMSEYDEAICICDDGIGEGNHLASCPALDFKNESGLKFTLIMSEQWREYRYPGGDVVRIDAPKLLNVSKSGGHRIWDVYGVSHYIPPKWIHLRWIPWTGHPHFVK